MEVCFLVPILLVGPVVILGLIIHWVLGPVDRAAKDCRLPTQFTIADFLCLFALFQFPPMLFHCFPNDLEETTPLRVIPFYVLGWLAIFAVWWVGVGTLSRAGIIRPWHRVVFLLGIFPLVLVGMFAQMVAPVWLLTTFHPAALASQVGLIVLFYGLGQIVRSLLKAAKRPADAPPAAPEDPEPPTLPGDPPA